MQSETAERVDSATWRRQALAILSAWGMSDAHAAVTADVLVAADLMGIDSHGLTLLPLYDQQLGNGGATATPNIEVVHDMGAVALIDGDAGFGQQGLCRVFFEIHLPYFSQCAPNNSSSDGLSSAIVVTKWVMLMKCL